MKVWVGWSLFALALVPWAVGLLISPYDTMGTEPHNIRANVALILLSCAAAATLLFGVSVALLFTGGTKLQGRSRPAIGAMFLFFLTTTIASGIRALQALSDVPLYPRLHSTMCELAQFQ